jgi:putative methylase
MGRVKSEHMTLKHNKKGLAIALSSLKGFTNPKIRAEQYMTDSEIAATALWDAYMHGDIEGKVIADLGAGTGILGLGALLLGAKKVFLVEKDKDAMKTCMENFEFLKRDFLFEGEADFILADIKDFYAKTDIVVENPPFGTRDEHADREFLEKAFETAPLVYSFHKASTEKFVNAFSDDKGFKVAGVIGFSFPLKKTFSHQTRKIHNINVSLFRIEKT